MIKEDIEIGIKITPSIYLTIHEDLGTAPFDVDTIVGVKEDGENGSIVAVAEPESTFSSRMIPTDYHVLNSCDKIREAIDDARMYKHAGLERIKELLDKEEGQ
jgi:hypothetical protein